MSAHSCFVVQFASLGVTPSYMIQGGTPHWTAPEILLGSAPVSPATDVYALANVLFEIVSRETPFAEEHSSSVVASHIKSGRRPTWPACPAMAASQGSDLRAVVAGCEVASHARMKALVVQAWSQDSMERPTAASLAGDVETLRIEYLAQISEAKLQHRLHLATSSSAVALRP
jgi:serine/threonine protein kinase